MAELSNRLNRLAPSATLAMSQKSSEMKAQGVDVINLSVGEPDFNTPDHIKEAAKKAVDENFSRYSPVPGYMDLRKAIVAKLKNENNATVVITHYQRLLDYIVPDYIHILYHGRIVMTADKSLALELEEKGYDWIKEQFPD